MLESVILGLIQGITEFLPISSSGHLILIPKIFGWQDQGLAFDVVVHLGSLVAVVFVFRKKLAEILRGIFGQGRGAEKNSQLGVLIILSIIPAGIIGYLFGDYIENNLRSKFVVAASLIFWGIFLWLANRYSRKAHYKTQNVNSVGVWQTIVVSISQAIALIPGTSRSGITMSAGLFTKMSRHTAVEFSFLMSIPIIAIAGAWELLNLFKVGFGAIDLGNLIMGFVAAAVSGFMAIKLLLAFVKHWGFGLFAVYRIALGAAVLILL